MVNMTALDAANTTLEVISGVNDLTGDWWARLFLIGIFVLIAASSALKGGEVLKGLVAGSFVTTIVAMLFYAAGLTYYTEPLLSLLALVAFTITLWAGGKP